MSHIKRFVFSFASWIAGCIVWVGACSPAVRTSYEQYAALPVAGWEDHRPAEICLSVDPDSTAGYDVALDLRHSGEYPYDNLWITMIVLLPDSTCFRQDTLQLCLVDEAGQWKGRGWGHLYALRAPAVMTGIRLSLPGEYVFRIQHQMGPGVLKGIHDIGVCLSRSDRP